MIPKEKVIAQIQHRETPGLPYTLGFEGDVAERLDAYYGGTGWRSRLDNAIRHVPGADNGIAFDRGPRVQDMFGTLWRVDQRPFHLEEPGLKRPDFEGYTFPRVEECFAEGWRERALQAIEEDEEHFLVRSV